MIRAAEARHFLLFDVGTALAALAAAYGLSRIGASAVGVAIFVAMWVLNLVGVEVGFHRLFSHAAFSAGPRLRATLVALGSMGAQGPVISWASNHRHHHQHSDGPEDTHTPHGRRRGLRGLWHAHLGWKASYPYPSPSHYTPALLRDRAVLLASRRYHLWIGLGLLAPALATGALTWSWRGALEGLLLGGVLRLFLGQHVTWCINSICHLYGQRPFATGDRSTNNAWLALPTLGGSWHNNHHAFPRSANNGLEWWQLDPCYWIIRGLARLGLVWDVKVPERQLVVSRRRASEEKRCP